MINPIEGETRQEYLLRVAVAYLRSNPVQDYTVNYDETTCDGHCLAVDIEAELDRYRDPTPAPKERIW